MRARRKYQPPKCLTEGCKNPALIFGFCGTHYRRWKKTNPAEHARLSNLSRADRAAEIARMRPLPNVISVTGVATPTPQPWEWEGDSEALAAMCEQGE